MFEIIAFYCKRSDQTFVDNFTRRQTFPGGELGPTPTKGHVYGPRGGTWPGAPPLLRH